MTTYLSTFFDTFQYPFSHDLYSTLVHRLMGGQTILAFGTVQQINDRPRKGGGGEGEGLRFPNYMYGCCLHCVPNIDY